MCEGESVTRKSTPDQPSRRRVDRQSSVLGAERLFDLFMMVLFGLLGVMLTVIGAMLPAAGLGILGGLLVTASVVPLWLGSRPVQGRPGRNLRWYPIAAAVLAIGLFVWVHPWTG